MGGLFSIWEGIHKLQSPEPLNQPWVGMVVLAAAIVLEVAGTTSMKLSEGFTRPVPSVLLE